MRRPFSDLIANNIEYRFWPGTGARTVVMLHGIGSNRTSFDPLANAMPNSWNLIAWNAPGYGSSSRLKPQFPQAIDYALALEKLVSTLELERILLIGHSLGTLIGATYCHQYPQKVSSLILLSAAQGYDQPVGQLTSSATLRLTELDQLGADAFAEKRADRLLFNPEQSADARKLVRRAMAQVNPSGYAQAVHMLSASNLNKICLNVQMPSLVIVGSEDVITPPVQSQQAHDALKSNSSNLNHEYREIPAAGHAVHQQKPVEVASAITAFTDQQNSIYSESVA